MPNYSFSNFKALVTSGLWEFYISKPVEIPDEKLKAFHKSNYNAKETIERLAKEYNYAKRPRKQPYGKNGKVVD